MFRVEAEADCDDVPAPTATTDFPDPGALIGLAANCCNSALERIPIGWNIAGVGEGQEKANNFSPQNSLKAKDSLLNNIALIGPGSYTEPRRRGPPFGRALIGPLVDAPPREARRRATEMFQYCNDDDETVVNAARCVLRLPDPEDALSDAEGRHGLVPA